MGIRFLSHNSAEFRFQDIKLFLNRGRQLIAESGIEFFDTETDFEPLSPMLIKATVPTIELIVNTISASVTPTKEPHTTRKNFFNISL